MPATLLFLISTLGPFSAPATFFFRVSNLNPNFFSFLLLVFFSRIPEINQLCRLLSISGCPNLTPVRSEQIQAKPALLAIVGTRVCPILSCCSSQISFIHCSVTPAPPFFSNNRFHHSTSGSICSFQIFSTLEISVKLLSCKLPIT
jgi:hypothetical protein